MKKETETITAKRWTDGGSVVLYTDRIKTETNSESEYFSSLEKGVKQVKTEQWRHRVQMGFFGAMGAVTFISGLRELTLGLNAVIHGIKPDVEHVYPGLVFLYFGYLALSWAKEYLDMQNLDKRKLSKLEEIGKK